MTKERNSESAGALLGRLSRMLQDTEIKVWDLWVGPAGVGIDAWSEPRQSDLSRPDVAFWLQGGIEITNRQAKLFTSGLFPDTDYQPRLQSLLKGRRVEEVLISPRSNRLQVLLEGDVLITGVPVEFEGEHYPSILYVYDPLKVRYLIIETQTIWYCEEPPWKPIKTV